MSALLTKPVESGHCKPADPVTAKTTRPARTEDIVSDRAVTADGHEVPPRHVAIRALAASESAAGAGVGDGRARMGTPAGMRGAGRGSLRGGGLVGRTAGGVGGEVGGTVGGAGSLGAGGLHTLQPEPGAVGGLDASRMLTSESRGVLGLRGITLDSGSATSTSGSVTTSSGKSLRLDQGTQPEPDRR